MSAPELETLAAGAAVPELARDRCATCACFEPPKSGDENARLSVAALGFDVAKGVCKEGPTPYPKLGDDWCGRHRRAAPRPPSTEA